MIDLVYLFLGPEEGKKKAEISKIEKYVSKQLGSEPEKHQFYPFEKKVSEIISLMKNGSLFSSHKFIIINNAEEIKKKSDVDLIIEICKKPIKGNTLILKSSNSSIDKKIEKVIPKANKIIFWEMFENQKKSWISSYFNSYEQKINPNAVDHLLEMVENNTQELKIACEKISFFFDKGKIITEDDIDTFLYHSREENVFTLFEKMCFKDLLSSLEINNKLALSSDNTPIAIVSGLLWQFKRLLNLKISISRRVPMQEAMLKQGIRGKKNQQSYQAALGNYSLHELQKIILILSDHDFLLRNAKTEMQKVIIEILIYKCLVKVS
ncbi:DNA polymerase III subunit delta [Thiospirochaeta perfilievii]|uniref:DNA polymerase III subunit delta n=1 Tax=Thiospirochaeta perfilievii TaxID=252967 RepID=A0A5C1QBP1_9SPIO|nr:DNA polymerase III subunit delta [Thiospirochaeta perfilievii]QEN04808.1 DNA polymerase III subunit delta [Thiospirochaeta perfilievii]